MDVEEEIFQAGLNSFIRQIFLCLFGGGYPKKKLASFWNTVEMAIEWCKFVLYLVLMP